MGHTISKNVTVDAVLSPEDAAYIAGLLDGEGSIYLLARKGKGRRSHHFHPKCSIANTKIDVLAWIVEVAGCGRVCIQDASAGRKPCYQWAIEAGQMRRVIPQLLPYLRIKRAQAELMLRYFAIQDSGRLCPSGLRTVAENDIPQILAIYDELRRLNQRGDELPEPIQFLIGDRAPQPVRRCTIDGCSRMLYPGHSWCYKHWLERREPNLRECQYCGQEFDAVKECKRFCAPRCQYQSWQRRQDGKTERRVHVKLTEADVREMVRLFNTGEYTQTELAQRFHTDRSNVQSILSGKTWAYLNLELPGDTAQRGARHWSQRCPSAVPRGSARKHSKLNEETVRELRRRYKAGGVTYKALAVHYGISFAATRDAVIGKTWAHVPYD